MAYLTPDEDWLENQTLEELRAISALLTAAHKPLVEPDFPVEGFTVYEDILDAEVLEDA